MSSNDDYCLSLDESDYESDGQITAKSNLIETFTDIFDEKCTKKGYITSENEEDEEDEKKEENEKSGKKKKFG